MKIGLLGLPGSGKSSVFRAVTGRGQEHHSGDDIAVLKVPDQLLQQIADFYQSKKVTMAELALVDVTALSKGEDVAGRQRHLSQLAGDADAFALVIQAFGTMDYTGGELDPRGDLETLILELALTDLDVIAARIERIQNGPKVDRGQFELNTLQKAHDHLAAGGLLAGLDLSPEEQKALRGFRLLTARPMLIVFNVGEDDLRGEGIATAREYADSLEIPSLVFCAELEEELAALGDEERGAFLADFGLEASARDRLIRAAYETVNAVTFYTAAHNESRAWTVQRGTRAREAAGKIHTDLADNFVRAEVIKSSVLLQCASEAECRERGAISLEGAEYVIEEGDIVLIRFTH